MKRFLTVIGMFLIGMLSLSGLTHIAHAIEYPLPPANSRLIGENSAYIVPDDGRPLEFIAAKYQIGLLAMLEANPGVDPYLPKPDTELTIPSQMLLPDTPRRGIIINLAELRLYYFPEGKNYVVVYPIGIGQLGRNTPTMTTSVSQLIKNPTWTPTVNIRKDYASRGIILPAVIPAGPDNPMGDFALRLAAGRGEYLIHGTNANFGIGMRVSSGCIRLRPDDIEALFQTVPRGTRVQVMNEPVKYAIEPDGKRYVEVHQPLSNKETDDPQTMPVPRSEGLVGFVNHRETDEFLVDQAIIRRAGVPVQVNIELTTNSQAEKAILRSIEDVAGPEIKPAKIPPLNQPRPIYQPET
ncbi:MULTISPECIES: L,D-transpeptidase family protein [Xenorhabdus]|uniref:L,D-transpeptidase family protein n=1 Tax=Xenorhabdus TaxID=626 RepID=UPI00064A07A5|nr:MULTISPECIES: L,D-transpeptidase family protein [Xenorhabdus]KLU15244.1 peptidoglycan-binding protein [Xenorhabdus griffiniae]KOP32144.1 peptidoglycan-binding protein [Xenorhabdus sp. GDc328]